MLNVADFSFPIDVGNQPTISRVINKLPPFWRTSPGAWSNQSESLFRLAGITQDSTKYDHRLVSLDESLITPVEIIVTDEKRK